LLHIKALTLKQLNENQLENIRQLSDLQLQISAEQLRRKNLMPEETQFYIDSLTKGFQFYLKKYYFRLKIISDKNLSFKKIKKNTTFIWSKFFTTKNFII
jgi:hypothetical protein